MESDTSLEINTGVALLNLEPEENVLDVQLIDAQGGLVAEAQVRLPAMARHAVFVNEFEWEQEVDFTAFEGSLRVRSSGPLAAIVIQTRPGNVARLIAAERVVACTREPCVYCGGDPC